MKHRKLRTTELKRPDPETFRKSPKLRLSFLLDDIRSANNVGSVFRTADGFALEHVYLCGITAQPPHRDILKTALGATRTVEWSYHASAAELVGQLREAGACVRALEQTENARLLRDTEVDDRALVIVLGNEVKGVQQGVIDACDGAIEIAQFGTKHSLNVAVAAGMVAWELSRQLRRT